MHEGKKLEKLYEETGLSKKVFAEKLNYTRQSIYALFKEEKLPLKAIENVRKVFNLDLRPPKSSSINLVNEPQEFYGNKPITIKITYEISGGDQKEQSEFMLALDEFAKNYQKKLPKKKDSKK